MKRKRPEQDIQINLMAYIAQAGAKGLVAAHVPNGVNSGPFVGAIMQRMGLMPGFPDLILFHQGRSFALEIKADKGKLSEDQALTISQLREAGVECAVAYGLDQCIEQLVAWGLTREQHKRVAA